MKNASFFSSILASLLTLPLTAQVILVPSPENGKNCKHQDYFDRTPWTPPGEPTSAEHFEWDNFNWQTTSYSYYEYDSNGRLAVHMINNENNAPKYRLEYTYDAQGQLIDKMKYDYSAGPTTWIPKWHEVLTYDNLGRSIEVFTETYGLGQWYNLGLSKREYDSHNFETLQISFDWNAQTDSWDTLNVWQTNFTYDANGYPHESFERYRLNGGPWTNAYHKKYVLDGNNEVVEIQQDSWNGSTFAPSKYFMDITWLNTSIRIMGDYNFFTWNGAAYTLHYRLSTTQGTCGRSILRESESWDGSTFTLDYTSHQRYDDNGTYRGLSFTRLDPATSTWVADAYSVGTPIYDANGAILEYTFQEVDANDVLQNENKTIYAFNVGLEEALSEGAMEVYPSPANDIVNLSFENIAAKEIQLFSTTGQLIETFGANTRQIATVHLPNGIYFVIVQTDNGQQLQRKFVVQH